MKQPGNVIPEFVAQRLEKQQTELSRLQAKLDAQNQSDPLLIELAEALNLAAISTHPAKGRIIDGDPIKHSPDPPDPAAYTRAAVRAETNLRNRIRRALHEFHRAAEYDWRPPRREPDPQVRCVRKACSAYGKRIPKYVGPRGSKIELSHCSVCDNRLASA